MGDQLVTEAGGLTKEGVGEVINGPKTNLVIDFLPFGADGLARLRRRSGPAVGLQRPVAIGPASFPGWSLSSERAEEAGLGRMESPRWTAFPGASVTVGHPFQGIPKHYGKSH